MSYEGIKNARYYTIITSAFNHAGLLHLGFNMWALWGFGQIAILYFAIPKFGPYVGSILAGGLAQYYDWQHTQNYHAEAVGASGGLCGIIGALTSIAPRHPVYNLGCTNANGKLFPFQFQFNAIEK